MQSSTRLDDMVERILWALFAKGAVDHPVRSRQSTTPPMRVSQKAAEESLVLLKNEGDLLPLHGVKSIAMIGGNADQGVLAGGGSSDVTPVGGAMMIDGHTYLPSPPLAALKSELPRAKIAFDAGTDLAAAAALAAAVRCRHRLRHPAQQRRLRGQLEMDGNQDELVAAVAKANPKTIVVVETGGAISCHGRRSARDPRSLLPGIRGGPAIARILTGKVNPSGHLPISFPASADQLAHPEIPGLGQPGETPAKSFTTKARRSGTNGTT